MRVTTGFSFRHSYGKIDEVVSRLQDIGWTEAPVCDHLSTFSFVRYTKACKDAGLRPIYGVTIPCVPALGEKKPRASSWSFFAKDSLRAIHDLITKATSNPGKEASLLYRQALEAPGVIIVADERLLVDEFPGSWLGNAALANFYVALSPATPKGLIRRATERGLRMIASSCNAFPREADLEQYRVCLGFRASTQVHPQHLCSDQELRAWFAQAEVPDQIVAEAFANRDRAMARCRATMRKASMLQPDNPRPLIEMCREGAEAKGVDLSDPVYAERLARELDLIEAKAFGDYFRIVSDLMVFARNNMVVGPGRGSSGSSLVCYLLGITALDPLRWDLLFERFVDVNRPELPDIDIDLSDERRDLVFEYADQKYGKSRTARLGSVNVFQAKASINQIGAVLKIPKWKLEKLALIDRADGDDRALNCLADTLSDTREGQALIREHPEVALCAGMEGHPSHAGVHAAGLLMTQEDISEFVAVSARNGVGMADKEDAEALDLLKIDCLGLKQLGVFERCLDLMGKPQRSDWLESLPLDDGPTFDLLNRKAYAGVFQFGHALKGIAEQVRIESLNDIVSLTALARPGPAINAPLWVSRRNGQRAVTYDHPLLEPILKDTLGIILFQEQVLRIGREVGAMSWPDVSRLRKDISKSQGGEAINRHGVTWKAGAMANGLDEHTCDRLWRDICSHGGYSFNKSHAVAYSILSYWCAYLKCHFSTEFAAATLDREADPGKQVALLRELHDEGIGYVPLDISASAERWAIKTDDTGAKTLVGPLTGVKGIGPSAVREILEARRQNAEVRPALAKRIAGARTSIDTLWPVAHAIKTLHPDLGLINIFSEPTPCARIQPGETMGEILVLGLVKRVSVKQENSPEEIAKRGGRRVFGDQSLNIFLEDDSGEVLCKVDRRDFARLGQKLLDEIKPGKTLAGFKGSCPPSFRMISIKNARLLGEMPS
jgi:DNA polymerase III subunit alpha